MFHLVESSLPNGFFLAGNGALPVEQVECAVGVLDGFGDESEGMVFAPGLPLLRQTALCNSAHCVKAAQKIK